ncbi:hypothetical protein GCM10007276_18270 [Agaricicola taiwanensis]|uniref:Uncharacterized protein n=1 Tax=Agaricicola taiwanensis TaxID=591372 RepID=A0A8J2YH69_9RHOB|nr:hypothetical protein [Agaricicola taiwanensis]GGE41251.1 hypothetical protein GCM10007276_18270 [Agaricicola taiwanensis]
MSTADPLWVEFSTLFKRSGLSLPEERQPVLFAAYREVRAWSDTIRAWENPPAAEPANAYAVASILRAGEVAR